MKYSIGIDVGTGSVRAALFSLQGVKLSEAEQEISKFEPELNFIEQSSNNIWQSVCKVVKEILAKSEVDVKDVIGIGFDATCSLVALDKNLEPASVSPTTNNEQNIILWMDHRAIEQADLINSKDYEVLKYIGGKISLEMEIPKILWLKQNKKDLYDNIAHFLDLSDFLTLKATGSFKRSACTTTCKWTYLNKQNKWSREFFADLNLLDLLDENKIGDEIVQVGEFIGNLTKQSAKELGLHSGVAVCAGMIDAHAGGVAVLGDSVENTLALITGTSACHMLCTKEESFVSGIWGPYFGAMLPNLWLMEGGQSTAGALVEHVIKESSQYPKLEAMAIKQNCSIYQILNDIVLNLEQENKYLTQDYHILGYFLGNRSPLADPKLKGMISGLSLHDNNLEALAIRYLSSLQTVAYGTKHIIEELNKTNCKVNKIRMCGGGTKNPLWLREHANIINIPIETIEESEAMLLGSAILGAYSAKAFDSLNEAMKNMSKLGGITNPEAETQDFHQKKYKVFRKMHQDFLSYRELMK